MIEPLRSDFANLKIYTEDPKINDANYLVLGSKNQLHINIYKTKKSYGPLIIDIPPSLFNEIINSLKQKPREYLFTTKSGKPYLKANSFDKWANRELKKVFKKPDFSLVMFRHIYLSNPNLHLKDKNLSERQEIAHNMGHSTTQQDRYRWI